eukprot:COSAG04_NODE_8485_length_967_cov_7.180876_2_plen_71_part_00
MTTVGLIAGTSFVPLLFTLRANSVGASDMARDIVFNAFGAHLRSSDGPLNLSTILSIVNRLSAPLLDVQQ